MSSITWQKFKDSIQVSYDNNTVIEGLCVRKQNAKRVEYRGDVYYYTGDAHMFNTVLYYLYGELTTELMSMRNLDLSVIFKKNGRWIFFQSIGDSLPYLYDLTNGSENGIVIGCYTQEVWAISRVCDTSLATANKMLSLYRGEGFYPYIGDVLYDIYDNKGNLLSSERRKGSVKECDEGLKEI